MFEILFQTLLRAWSSQKQVVLDKKCACWNVSWVSRRCLYHADKSYLLISDSLMQPWKIQNSISLWINTAWNCSAPLILASTLQAQHPAGTQTFGKSQILQASVLHLLLLWRVLGHISEVPVVWGSARESVLSAAFLQCIVIRNTCDQDQTQLRWICIKWWLPMYSMLFL